VITGIIIIIIIIIVPSEQEGAAYSWGAGMYNFAVIHKNLIYKAECSRVCVCLYPIQIHISEPI
jgi:hypothetical protein